MEGKIRQLETRYPQRLQNSLQSIPSWAIGMSTFGLGFVVGSGRWRWFAKELAGIAGGLGIFMLQTATNSLKEQNPQWFSDLPHKNTTTP